jgi:hypothetical protein
VTLEGYRCASCPGVAHPSTGHYHSPRVLICAACARLWFAWLVKHTRPRKGTDFYGAATKHKQLAGDTHH